jgi:thiamine-phosphate pyrophosphorylase
MRNPPRAPALYGIADAQTLAPTPLSVGVEKMAQAGVRWIQIRAKKLSDMELFEQVEVCCERLQGTPAELWIDDRADLASLMPACGVHLGQRDVAPWVARRLLGEEKWIGLSTHNRGQLEAAEADPDVDLIAVGPVFTTASKERPDPVVGLELVRWARQFSNKPLVAIGGIDATNAAQVLQAGADGVAVIGALCRGDVDRNSQRFLRAVEGVA